MPWKQGRGRKSLEERLKEWDDEVKKRGRREDILPEDIEEIQDG